MKRIHALAVVLAVGFALFTGAALAGGGNGNGGGNSGSPPGQEKKAEEAAQPQPAPAAPAQPAPAQQAQAPAKSSGKSSSAPGQVKKSSSSTQQSTHTSSHGIHSTSAGVKPSNTTSKNTKCFTGAGATCGPGSQPDNSKRYGNGKTAAQIATSRGAPAGTEIRGPGNSQPHKVCGKNGHFVDVHAVKRYPVPACAPAQPAQTHQVQQPAPVQQSSCPQTSTVTSTQVLGIWHLNGKGEKVHLMTNPKSAHFRGKHGDHELETATVTRTVVTGSGACAQVQTQQAQQSAQVQAQQAAAPTANASNVSNAQSSQAPSSGAVAAGSQQPSAGGVLGAQATVKKSKAKPAGGVLGTAGRVAGTSLPFTGLPLWTAVMAAAALLAGGLLVRRLAAARH